MLWPPPRDVEENAKWWNSFWDEEFENGFGKASRAILDFIPQPLEGCTAVDIASGNGRYALLLAQMGYQTTALELSASGVAGIKTKAEKLELELNVIHGDFFLESQKEKTFDLILCSGLLEEIPCSTFKAVVDGFVNWSRHGTIVINRYCLEINGRGILIEDDGVIKLYDPKLWEIIHYNELKYLKPSKGGFDIRHGTIVVKRK